MKRNHPSFEPNRYLGTGAWMLLPVGLSGDILLRRYEEYRPGRVGPRHVEEPLRDQVNHPSRGVVSTWR